MWFPPLSLPESLVNKRYTTFLTYKVEKNRVVLRRVDKPLIYKLSFALSECCIYVCLYRLIVKVLFAFVQ